MHSEQHPRGGDGPGVRLPELEPALRHHYLFAALSAEHCGRLLKHTHVQEFARGQVLFAQGDSAHAFFVVRSGGIKLYRVSPDGQEKIMRLVGPGQSFAESVMFMDEPRYPVHAEAMRPSALLAVDSAACLDLLRESFSTCRAVMAQMTRRIQAHWDEIEALTIQNSRYRVVHYFLELLAEREGRDLHVTLPQHKAVIAARLGIRPETFSRILRSLSDEGLVAIDRDTVVVFDRQALIGAGR